ncbi:MAG TPA: HXXEE domain-containing protein [Gemmatimonadaceae bacterium]|nr:HXXEE domain-containing protein [Gemmatimonadaceae bacterium]
MVVALAVAVACVLTLATMGRATIFLVVAMLLCYALWVRRTEWPPGETVLGVYALAVLVQCAHSVEEYLAGFYRVFPPVFGASPWSGRRFLIFNLVWLTIFVFAGVGLSRGRRAAHLVALFLAIGGGIGNGLGHLALSARGGGYFPGAYTGVLALLVGSLLAYRLIRKPAHIVSAAHNAESQS